MDDELFDIVNDDDEVIGRASRSEVHRKGHIHRSVLFFLFDRGLRVFVNQRTANKDFYPEYWSIVLGGHVHAGETYEDALLREASEEAGIDAEPFFIAPFKKRFDAKDKENARVFGFILDREPSLDASEISQGHFAALDELERRLEEEPFLPETPVLFQILRRWLRCPER